MQIWSYRSVRYSSLFIYLSLQLPQKLIPAFASVNRVLLYLTVESAFYSQWSNQTNIFKNLRTWNNQTSIRSSTSCVFHIIMCASTIKYLYAIISFIISVVYLHWQCSVHVRAHWNNKYTELAARIP